MPIHDQGYRRYGGRRVPRGQGWRVIAGATIRAEIRQRRVVLLLLFAWAPFLVRAVFLYAAANFPQASALGASPQMFREFLDWQNLFIFFVTILIGSGLIADDRRVNALQIYLSKPLTRVEYIAGKLLALAAFLAFVTWLPGILLLLLQMLFAGNTDFLREHAFLLPAITLYAAIQILVSSFAMLALSSLSRSRRFVAMLYAGIILFTAAMQEALQQITRSRSWVWISPGDTLDVIADAIFRVGTDPPIPVTAAVVAIAVLVVVSAVVLERRVRGVEVVT
jgi:ABC-2 type transport system permease protein